MKKFILASLFIIMLTASATAAHQPNATHSQNATPVEPNPGIIGPGSIFYGLELTVDRISMSVGLTTAQEVADERASEALVAAQRNNTKGVERALKQVERLSRNHNIAGENGTSKALRMLGQVKEMVPEEAQQGINTAMNNIQKNVPVEIPGGPSTGLPSDERPGNKTVPMDRTNGSMTDTPSPGNMTDGTTGDLNTTNQTEDGYSATSTTRETSTSTGRFYLLVSDRPADISDFDYLNVTFEKARIFKAGDSNSENTTTENITTNSTETNNTTENQTAESSNEGFTTVQLNGTADLTQVVGDKAKSIADLDLEEGNYTKISLYAESIQASVNGSQVDVKIPPGKLMITKSFIISSNQTTGFVFDIGVFLRGNQQNNQGYILKPVISQSGVAGKDVAVNLTNKKSMKQLPDFASQGSEGRPENTNSGQQNQNRNQTSNRP